MEKNARERYDKYLAECKTLYSNAICMSDSLTTDVSFNDAGSHHKIGNKNSGNVVRSLNSTILE